MSGCGGGGGGTPAASGTTPGSGITTSYTIGGAVTGLTGTVVLQDNNGDDLSISANDNFIFATSVAHGSSYSVSVLTQPTGQSCSIANGTGTIAAANVGNVAITCAANTYTVGGAVTGLSGSVVLQNNLSDNHTVSTNGSFVFPSAVTYGNPYSVTVFTQPHSQTQTCTVSNGSGNVTAAITTVAVDCVAKAWGTAALIETNNLGGAQSPQIAFDANGNALAVWAHRGDWYYSIWANRYTAGTGWGTPELIETSDLSDAMAPQIAIDANGNALAVWEQSDGTVYNIWANRYTSGTGWGTAELIETNDVGDGSSAKIAIDANGNALAVWEQHDGTRYNIWANRYTAGTGWGTAELIETDDAGTAIYAEIAFDPNGNALAVWQQSDALGMLPRYDIWANRYTAGTGWGTATLLEADNADAAAYPQIAIDANGNALAVWHQSDGTRNNIWANRYTSGAGWGAAALIETDNLGNAKNPQVAINADGNAFAVWGQFDGLQENIWANLFR